MARAVKWIATTIAAVAALVVIFLIVLFIVFDWNMLRGPLSSWISRETGREFAIEGDLHGEFAWTPWIRAEGVRLANAEWASEDNMVEIGTLALRIDLRALLRGEVVIPALRLDRARLNLEIDEEGRQNWELGDEPAEDVSDLPVIERLVIEDSQLVLRDRGRGIEYDATVNTLAGISPEEGVLPVNLEGAGNIENEPFSLVVRAAPLQDLVREEDEPYPIEIHIDTADTEASLIGRLTQPEGLAGIDAALQIEGPNAARLAPLLGIPLPSTPPYAVSGRLIREGDHWRFEDFDGVVGDSDLAGSLAVDAERERPFMTADLISRNLDFADLGALVGLDPELLEADQGESEGAPERMLPDASLQLEQVRGTDASVTFRGERVVAPGLPLTGVSLTLELQEGVLQLAPLAFGVAGGQLSLYTSIYSTQEPVRADYDIRLSDAHLQRILAGAGLEGAGEGVLQGRARFSTFGDTLRTAMAVAEGDAAIVMDRARIEGSALALIDVSFLEALAVVLTDGEPEAMDIRCFIAAFDIQEGVMRADPMVLDTEDSLIIGEGQVDLREEVLDLRISGEPKDFTIAAARFPVEITGPLAAPEVAVDATEIAIRGGLAAALGVLLTPLAAVIPLIDPGLAEDSVCWELIAEAEEEVEE